MVKSTGNLDHYPITCKYESDIYFMIYAMGDTDHIVSKNDKFLVFETLADLESHALQNSLSNFHEGYEAVYEMEYVKKFVTSPIKSAMNFSMLMDCWNLFDDLTEFESETGREFRVISSQARRIYEMLLFEADIFGDGDIKAQCWSPDILLELKAVMTLGLAHFDRIINQR